MSQKIKLDAENYNILKILRIRMYMVWFKSPEITACENLDSNMTENIKSIKNCYKIINNVINKHFSKDILKDKTFPFMPGVWIFSETID